MKADDYPLRDEGYKLMGAAFEVYNELGFGLNEEIYQESIEKELGLQKIPFDSKAQLTVLYKGAPLKKKYIPDLTVFDDIIVELKSVKALLPEHEAQLLNYPRITKKPVGYLINYGKPGDLEWKRIVLTHN